MPGTPIRRIVIVGGGTAGWMCAAAFSCFFDDGQRTIAPEGNLFIDCTGFAWRKPVANSVDYMPSHRQFIAEHCAA